MFSRQHYLQSHGHYQTKTTNSLLGLLVTLIASKNYLHHFAESSELSTCDGLINLFLNKRFLSSTQESGVTILDIIKKKIVKKLVTCDFDRVTIESVKKFISNPNLKRLLRDQKLLFRKKDNKYIPWEPFFESVGIVMNQN